MSSTNSHEPAFFGVGLLVGAVLTALVGGAFLDDVLDAKDAKIEKNRNLAFLNAQLVTIEAGAELKEVLSKMGTPSGSIRPEDISSDDVIFIWGAEEIDWDANERYPSVTLRDGRVLETGSWWATLEK